MLEEDGDEEESQTISGGAAQRRPDGCTPLESRRTTGRPRRGSYEAVHGRPVFASFPYVRVGELGCNQLDSLELQIYY